MSASSLSWLSPSYGLPKTQCLESETETHVPLAPHASPLGILHFLAEVSREKSVAAICAWKMLLLLTAALGPAPQQLPQPQVEAESLEPGKDEQTPTSGTSQAVALPVSPANGMIGCY